MTDPASSMQPPPPSAPNTPSASAPTSPAAAATGAAAAAPPPRPKGLIRWGMLVAMIVLPLAVAFALKDRVALAAVRTVGARALGVPVDAESASVALFQGKVTIRGLKAVHPEHAEKTLFSAEEAVAHIQLSQALRGRAVIEELRVTKPRGKLIRRKDGSIGVSEEPIGPAEPVAPDDPGAPGEPGVPPEPGTPAWQERMRKLEEMARKRDFVEDLKKVVEKVRGYKEKSERERREREEQAKRGGIADPSGRARWVRADLPLVVITRIVCDDVEIDVVDHASEAPPLRLVQTRLELRNLSTDPFGHPDAMEIDLEGQLAEAAGSLVKLAGTLDLAGKDIQSTLAMVGRNLPATLLDHLVKDTLPVKFVGATLASLEMPLSLDGEAIDWTPIIDLAAIAVERRDPTQATIAGLPADKVITALREVQEIRFADLRVHGLLSRPEVEVGNTLQQVVTEGGKAYATRKAREKAGELEAKASAAAAAELSKQTERLQEKVGESETLKGLQETGAAAAGEGAAGVKDAATRALGGLFGGGTKPAEPDKDKK